MGILPSFDANSYAIKSVSDGPAKYGESGINGISLGFASISWESTVIASTKGRIYKICLQLNNASKKSAKKAQVLNGMQELTGSNPLASTIINPLATIR